MEKHRRGILVLAVAIGLATVSASVAAIAVTAAQSLASIKGFVSDKTINYWGYYNPVKPVVFANWKLDTLSLGPPQDFKDFEMGKARTGQLAGVDATPFTIIFAKTDPTKDAIPQSIEVHPTAYRVTSGGVSFAGDGKALGKITFEGTFSAPFLKIISAHRDAKNGTAVVLTGTLTAGNKSMPVSFTWYDGGD